jgi:hypothetical protein
MLWNHEKAPELQRMDLSKNKPYCFDQFVPKDDQSNSEQAFMLTSDNFEEVFKRCVLDAVVA